MSSSEPAASGTLVEQVRVRLEFADAVWRSGVGGRRQEGLSACTEALALLEARRADVSAEAHARLEASVWLKRGHLQEAQAAVGALDAGVEALRGYDRAIALLQSIPGEARGALLAGAWMNRGNALQGLGTSGARAEAVLSYDRAIALLEALAEERDGSPAAADPANTITLGAAWLNRGVACGGGAVDEVARAEARRSFERAITELAPLADGHAMARRHLAAAWTNLGHARADKDPRGAVAAQEAALAAAGADAGENERAGLLLNLGLARRAAGEHAAALELFRAVIAAEAARATRDPAGGEVALRARHAACVTLGEQLAAEGEAVTDATRERVSEAAALVAGGLERVRASRGPEGPAAGWGEPGSRLFEFGAWLYQTFGQGQLAPYLMAELEPADGRRIEIAWSAVERARQEIMQRGFEQLTGDAAGRIGAELAALREVEERLRALVVSGRR